MKSINTTIREAIERVDEQIEQSIYFYGDSETLFYIGRSDKPYERLRQHLGRGIYSSIPDYVGNFILENIPVSLEWIVQIATIRELAPDSCTSATVDMYIADRVERILINQFGPCLNATYNQNKKRLPDKYHRIANEGVKISEE